MGLRIFVWKKEQLIVKKWRKGGSRAAPRSSIRSKSRINNNSLLWQEDFPLWSVLELPKWLVDSNWLVSRQRNQCDETPWTACCARHPGQQHQSHATDFLQAVMFHCLKKQAMMPSTTSSSGTRSSCGWRGPSQRAIMYFTRMVLPPTPPTRSKSCVGKILLMPAWRSVALVFTRPKLYLDLKNFFWSITENDGNSTSHLNCESLCNKAKKVL